MAGKWRRPWCSCRYLALLGLWRPPAPPTVTRLPLDCRAPAEVYPAPQDLRLQVFSGLPMPELDLDPEAREIRDRYLEFARFPLLHRVQVLEDGLALEWLDLRFSVPGRVYPLCPANAPGPARAGAAMAPGPLRARG